MLRVRLFAASALACLVLPASAQDYVWDKIPTLGIKYRVHTKLYRLPQELGTEKYSHLKAEYKPKDAGDFISGRKGTYEWYLDVLEFPKIVKAESKDGEGKSLRDQIADKIKAANFQEYVSEANKDPQSSQRRFVTKNKEVAAKGKALPYRHWEYLDNQNSQIWYAMATVFDLPEREIALVVRLPVQKGERPADKHLDWARNMTASLAPLDEKELEAADPAAKSDKAKAEEASKDIGASTPEKKAALEAAKRNIASVKGWDYFTTENYIVLFSWDPEKPDKRQVMQTFGRNLADKLEKMRVLYLELYPPHANAVQNYSVLRICYEYQQFRQYGSGAGPGTIGWFSPATKELVMFKDDIGLGKGLAETVCFHEGWHQYSDSYFRRKGKKLDSKPKDPEGTGAAPTEKDGSDPGAELHRWFDEGTGDYFGSYVWNNGKWSYFASKMRKADIKVSVNTNKHVPLREIVTWNKDRFYGGRASDYYAQGYSMIDFFRRGKAMGNEFDPRWGKVLDIYRDTMLETGDQKKAVEAAFKDVDWDKLEAAWIKWVKEFLK